ncbi:MAG: hypothetical protein LBM19_03185 [Holosporales bacterium]|nr:hypothetical protein [Holosporales bacterium]
MKILTVDLSMPIPATRDSNLITPVGDVVSPQGATFDKPKNIKFLPTAAQMAIQKTVIYRKTRKNKSSPINLTFTHSEK